MKYVASIFFLFFSVSAYSEKYLCEEHPNWPDDRWFNAVIETHHGEQEVKATINSLVLSEPWPLSESCDSPNRITTIIGHQEASEVKLGPRNEKECGFSMHLIVLGSNPTMLSPRRSFKVLGEKPYLAKCHAI